MKVRSHLSREMLGAVCVAGSFAVGAVATSASHGASREARPVARSLSSVKGYLSGVTCFSASRCDAVGAFVSGTGADAVMAVLRTSDDGASWARTSIPMDRGDLSSISCPTSSVCSVVGTGGRTYLVPRIVRSTDGGARWSSHSLSGLRGQPTAISCASTRVCVAAGVFTRASSDVVISVVHSQNGGATWYAPRAPLSLGGGSGVSCPSTTVCEVVGTDVSSMGESAEVARTVDGGRSWARQSLHLSGRNTLLSSVDCLTTLDCEAVGSEASGALALRTTDGGRHWSRQDTPKSARILESVSCSSTKVCEAVGLGGPVGTAGYGVAMWSTDGGDRWEVGHVPAQVGILSGVSCATAESCMAVGYDDLYIVAIRSRNGGRSWSR